jgi:membrane-associated phospholipid phosphatase
MRVRWGRPLLGDARLTWAWLTLAGCVIVVVTLGLLLRGQTGPDGFDDTVDAPVIAVFGGHYSLLLWLARPATAVPAIAISAASAVGCLIAGRLNGAVLAVTAVPVAAALDDALLKPLFDRTLLGQLAFPSGHTTSVTAQAAMLAVLLLVPPQRQRTRTARVTLVTVYCVLTAALATAVVALRWHYFTDTVAGVAVGAGTVLALALLLDLASGVVNRTRKLPGERSPTSSPEIRTGPGGCAASSSAGPRAVPRQTGRPAPAGIQGCMTRP